MQRDAGSEKLRGSFKLQFSNHVSSSVPFNANAIALKKAIEDLPNVGSISVARVEISSTNYFGFEWTVTFTSVGSPSNIGAQDFFRIDEQQLIGSGLVTEVTKIREGCCTFSLSLNGYDYVSGKSFRYDDVTVATDIFPSSGPSSGGTVVIEEVTSLPFSKNIFCVFGSSSIRENNVNAEWLNSTHVSCITPAQDTSHSIPVRIRKYSLLHNRSQFSKSRIFFNYYLPPSVSHIKPNFGPVDGGYTVAVYGANFKPSEDLVCRLGDTVSEATFIDTSKVLCDIPALDIHADGAFAVGKILVSISNNGKDFSAEDITFKYTPRAEISSIEPARGMVHGGTKVLVHGNNFVENHALSCKFGDNIVKAVYHNADFIECVTPKHQNVPEVQTITVSSPKKVLA